jgi:hypothetical protein
MNQSDRDFVNESVKNTYYEKDDDAKEEEGEIIEPSRVPYLKILSVLCFLLAIGFMVV